MRPSRIAWSAIVVSGELGIASMISAMVVGGLPINASSFDAGAGADRSSCGSTISSGARSP
jgi:hypothetical protein